MDAESLGELPQPIPPPIEPALHPNPALH